MNAAVPNRADGDGVAHVSLADLIALRARVARVRVAPIVSRAGRNGQQSSRLYGRGMDYAESRVYQAGDDVRRLDWRLTARSGKLHTKLFQEDREGCLLILIDTHASMRFGTRVRFKSVQAARAAASAAWYAIRAGERVGVMAFGGVQRLQRPQAGSRGALAACGALADWDAVPIANDAGRDAVPIANDADRHEPLGDALARASRVLHGASRVLLISDGFCSDPSARQRLLDLDRRASLSVLVVADALELSMAPPGRYPMEHAGERSDVSLESERQRSDFQRLLGTGPAQLAELARASGLPCTSIDTSVDVFEPVTALLGAKRPPR